MEEMAVVNYTSYYELPPSDDAFETTMRYLLRIFCVMAILIEAIMIHTISKYKNMRQPDNLYIKCWLICDLLYLFLGLINHNLIDIYYARDYIDLIDSAPTIFRLMEIGFVILIMYYWCDGWRKPIFKIHYNKLMLGVLFFGLVNSLILIYACVWNGGDKFAYEVIYMCTDFFAIGMIFSISCCIRGFVSPFAKTSPLSIAICTSFILLRVLLKLEGFLLYKLLEDDHMSLVWSVICDQILNYSYPFIVFSLFYKIDPKFGICLRIILRRPVTDEEVQECYAELNGTEEPHLIESNTNNKV